MSGKRQNLYYQAVNMWSAGGLNTGIDLASRLTGARFDNGPRAHGVYPLISQCFVYDSEDERGVVEALLAQWIGLDEEEASDPPCRFCGDRGFVFREYVDKGKHGKMRTGCVCKVGDAWRRERMARG